MLTAVLDTMYELMWCVRDYFLGGGSQTQLSGGGHSSNIHGSRNQIDQENAVQIVIVIDVEKPRQTAMTAEAQLRING